MVLTSTLTHPLPQAYESSMLATVSTLNDKFDAVDSLWAAEVTAMNKEAGLAYGNESARVQVGGGKSGGELVGGKTITAPCASPSRVPSPRPSSHLVISRMAVPSFIGAPWLICSLVLSSSSGWMVTPSTSPDTAPARKT